jgi:gliding motility associated protien GldN
MRKIIVKTLLLVLSLGVFVSAEAQKKKTGTNKRVAQKRPATTTKKNIKSRTKSNIQSGQADTIAVAKAAEAPALNDSLPIKPVRKSLRPDEAVDTKEIKDRTPLAYEHLRADDAIFRHKIWREIDTREKINQTFNYKADENNGNQRFISILLKAIQDDAVTVFSNVDDRFTTPMTKAEVAKIIGGDEIDVPIFDSTGVQTGTKKMRNEVNLDSFYKFRIKEEVIFDKESSRLYWRILGIAPVKNVVTSMGVNLGETELFWVYYPDMRPIFSKYEVYNGKNFGARMSWEELFESRMFYGRIIKSTINNQNDLYIKNYKGLGDNTILQLLEGETIKETIFNYEQDLWSY